MAEAVLLSVKKVGNVLADEAANAVIAKVSEKVTNLKEMPEKVEEIRKQLTIMNSVILQIGTSYLTGIVVKNWIAEVRKLAYHVEDVMDNDIAEEVVKLEKQIQQVIKLKEQWLHPSQLNPNQLAETGRPRSHDNFPYLVKDEDLVGIEDHKRLLAGWLYSDEPDRAVITVSGIGGLGKTTLVTNVYEREKVNFAAHAWIVVSQTYNVEALLRKLLRKIGSTELSLDSLNNMDAHDLKEEIKKKIEDSKCLIVLDDVWDKKVYFQMQDAFQNLQATRVIITTRENDVAALATSTRRLNLQPLNGADAFELFCRRAFYNKGHKCPKELEKVANSIVDSLFPEDYTMTRESLLRLWVAEGFVLGKEKNTLEDVAEGNLMELIHRNMLEVVDNDEIGRVNSCKMHDIVRVLALSIAKEESYLTVLELQDSEITEVPTSIGNMFNLRYIGLRRTKVKSLPESIGKLSNLHTLDIKQTKIEKLPRSIVKIKKLRHLIADRYVDERQSDFRYFVGMHAPKELSNLQELQTLETVESSKDLAEQLKKLMQLRSSFPHLKTLVLKHMPNVNQLKIMDGALPSIEGLYVVSLSKLDIVPEGIESLRTLKKLWLLYLHRDFKTQWHKNRMHQKMQHVPEIRV
ncbi:hypothetical protein OsJ_33430 [Oryza sativa Japonica Group]|uniref:Uncharacterized protein n=1 Tax=Oryza sativa subsp. japonica TaxID=39947 RepID=B9GA25_ORYSJ|nr:hypothetical protein OsJ_33430 [Oryza sativa Japonica Group]